jgi:hypothetical protein
MKKILRILGGFLLLIAVADFAGMFLGYDFTGFSWSPILFGGLGMACFYLGKEIKLEDGEEVELTIGAALNKTDDGVRLIVSNLKVGLFPTFGEDIPIYYDQIVSLTETKPPKLALGRKAFLIKTKEDEHKIIVSKKEFDPVVKAIKTHLPQESMNNDESVEKKPTKEINE